MDTVEDEAFMRGTLTIEAPDSTAVVDFLDCPERVGVQVRMEVSNGSLSIEVHAPVGGEAIRWDKHEYEVELPVKDPLALAVDDWTDLACGGRVRTNAAGEPVEVSDNGIDMATTERIVTDLAGFGWKVEVGEWKDAPPRNWSAGQLNTPAPGEVIADVVKAVKLFPPEDETEEMETVAPTPLKRWSAVLDTLDCRKALAELLEFWFADDEDPSKLDVDKPINGGDAVDFVCNDVFGDRVFELAREMEANAKK